MNEFNNEKENGKNVYKILFIVVFVLLIGIIGYLTFTRVLNSKKLFGKEETKEVQEQKENDKKEDNKKEDEIAIPAVKKDIVQKINSLLKQFNQDETSYNANAYDFADYLLKNLELSDAQKQEIALKQAEKVKINIPKDKINIKEIQSDYDMIMEDYKNSSILEYYQVSSEEVEKNYKTYLIVK